MVQYRCGSAKSIKFILKFYWYVTASKSGFTWRTI